MLSRFQVIIGKLTNLFALYFHMKIPNTCVLSINFPAVSLSIENIACEFYASYIILILGPG